MQEDDLQIMQRVSARDKIRYDELDINLKDKIQGTICYVPINFTGLLSNLSTFRENLIDDKDFELHAAIEMLNVFAHYKHYFQSRDANHVILIGYVRDGHVYNMNKKILDMMCEFTNYFPNIYMIPNIMTNSSVLQVHIVASVLWYMKTITPNKNILSSVYLISSITSDRQLLYIFPTKAAYCIYKGYGFSPTVFLDKISYIQKTVKKNEFYDNSPHKSEIQLMNVLIGKYLNTTRHRNSKFDVQRVNYKTTKTFDKMNLINEFVESSYDPGQYINICNQFIKFLQSKGEFNDPESLKNLIAYEKYFDYRYQNVGQLNEIIMPLFENWKQKIKDYSIARDSENFKALNEHLMYSNWLLC